MNRICEICHKEFTKYQKRFCSYACRNVWRNKIFTTGEPPVTLRCDYCGGEFIRYKSQVKGKSIFCSGQCKDKWQKEHFVGEGNPRWDSNYPRYTHCLTCGKPLPTGHRNWRRKFCSRTCAGNYKPIEIRKVIGEQTQRRFQTPEFVAKWAKGLRLRPNKLERKLAGILDRYFPNEWEYTGDGKVTLNGLIPDFCKRDGKKAVIELFGDYWHRDMASRWKDTELGRIMAYNSLGFRCVVIWQHELKELPEDKIAQKISLISQGIGG